MRRLISGGDQHRDLRVAGFAGSVEFRNGCPRPAVIIDQCPIDDKEAATYERKQEDQHHFGVTVICKYRGNAGTGWKQENGSGAAMQ